MDIDISKADEIRDEVNSCPCPGSGSVPGPGPGPESCANCTSYQDPEHFMGLSEMDTEIASGNFLFEYDIQNSCMEKVSNMDAILEVFKIPCKVISTEPHPLRVPLCLQCSSILTDLYRLTEEFNSLRKIDSMVSHILTSHSELSSVAVGVNVDVDVNTIVLSSGDPTFHFPCPSSKENDDHDDDGITGEFIIDASGQGEVSVAEKEEAYLEMQQGRAGLGIAQITVTDDRVGGKSMGEELPLTSVIIVGADSMESIEVNNSLVPGGFTKPQSQPASVWLAPPGTSPNDSLVLPNSSTSSVGEDADMSSSRWELPRSTTAIAVPIGDNLLQLYRVAPVLPKEPPFVCMHCGKVKNSFISLKNHIHNVHNLHKSVTCPQCFKVFRKPCLLRKHSIVHSEGYIPREQKSKERNKPLLVCSWPDCGRSFLYKTSLQHHEARHRPERPFVCELCKKAFKLMGDLQIHKEFHKEDRPFVCDKCGRSYKVASNLQTHIINSHTEEGRLKYNEYMRKQTRKKRLKKIANRVQETFVNIVDQDLTTLNPSSPVDHDVFQDFVVAAEAEIETEEISETDFT